MTSDRGREEHRETIPMRVVAQGEREKGLARYDDTLSRAGQAADGWVQASIFEEYHLVKAPGTLQSHRYDLALFSNFLAAMGIERAPDALYADAHAWAGMTASLLISFRKWLLYPQHTPAQEQAKGYSIGSVRRRMATVRQYCKLAFRSGVIPPDEWTRLSVVKADSHAEGFNVDADRQRKRIMPRLTTRKTRATPISRAEFTSLRNTTTDIERYREHDVTLSERDALLICLLGEHGLRVGEVVALNVASINVRSNELEVRRPKTHDDDILPLLPATQRAAELYLAVCGKDGNGPLFVGYQGRRITRQGLYERVKNLGLLIGIPTLSPHDLRHFFAKNGIEMDNPLSVLQRYGGWKSGHMPLRYAKQYGATASMLKMGFEHEEDPERGNPDRE